MASRRAGWLVAALAVACVGVAACDRQGPAERIDRAADRADEAMGRAGDRMREPAEDARERVRNGVPDSQVYSRLPPCGGMTDNERV